MNVHYPLFLLINALDGIFVIDNPIRLSGEGVLGNGFDVAGLNQDLKLRSFLLVERDCETMLRRVNTSCRKVPSFALRMLQWGARQTVTM
jgi:hypothetical protein